MFLNALVLVTVLWSHPLTYVDNDPLPIEDIAATEVTWSRQFSNDPVGAVSVPGPANTVELDLSPGRYCFVLFTVTQGGTRSDPSDTYCHRVWNNPRRPIVIRIGPPLPP